MSEQIEIPPALPRGGDVRDKRVVLTGASRGLGRLLAHAFSQAGATVVIEDFLAGKPSPERTAE